MNFVLSLAVGGAACVSTADSSTAEPFDLADVRFEQNATDGDVEVVFEVTGGDEGLSELAIVGPDGRTVVSFDAPDLSTMGIRTFTFESPEPTDIEGLKAAYPEGIYRFSGTTVSGTSLTAQSELRHRLPITAEFVNPAPEAEGVSVNAVRMSWNGVAGVTHYIVEIEQEELDVSLTARLPATITTFTLPPGFLRPNTEYKMVLGTVTEDGNTSFVESSFTTGGSME